MKTIFATLRQLGSLVLLLIALPAAGGGAAGSQGPSFLGRGLDRTAIVNNVNGAYGTMGVQGFLTNSFPPNNEGALSGGPTTFKLHKLVCNKYPGNDLLAKCDAEVEFPGGKGPICGEEDNTNKTIKLIAVKGKWLQETSAPDLYDATSVIFACEEPTPKRADPDDVVGAVGKCVGAGLFPDTSPNSKATFLACLRAIRADYCGTGLSLTEKGTPLGIYDFRADGPHDACIAGGCFEASWNEAGATCISHKRYEHLVRMATIERLQSAHVAHPPKKVAEVHDHLKIIKGGGGQAVQATVPNAGAPPPPKLGVDQLRYCDTRTGPLAACVNQYTDFYYDDNHRMPTAGAWNPVDAATAQYVCKSGATRGTSWVLTRTKVRWFVSPGPVEVLDCCDTLKCPW